MFKLERKTNKVDDYEQSSEILLDMADKSFNYHYDMSKRIENKSNMIIVIIGILFTISSGNLIKDVINNNLEMKNICIVLFLLNVIFYFIAIYFFIQVLKLQDYYLLREDIFKESNLEVRKIKMEEYIVGKYREMIIKISNENKKKAIYYKHGLISTFWGILINFILIFLEVIL